MDFDELNPLPIVQRKKKYQTFTIKPIGGPAEIIKWREMQAAKESMYLARLKTRDERITEFEKTTGQKLAAPEVKSKSIDEKIQDAEQAKREFKRLQEEAKRSYEPSPFTQAEPHPKPTLIKRITGFMKRIWKSANF